MYKIDNDKAKKILVSELGFSSEFADQYLGKFPLLHDIFGPVVEQWLVDRSIAPVSIDGLSIEQVMKLKQTNFLSAVQSLEVLLKEDMPEEERRKYRAALAMPLSVE